jgi:short-chain Z-isoprenyl diphosphate synthase
MAERGDLMSAAERWRQGMLKQLLYRLYEGRLFQEVQGGELPRHIGLILDGNRRYARERGYSNILEGHRRGAEKLEEVLGWCEELEIRMVTVWIFSTENVSRSQEEVDGILELIEKKMREIALDPKVHRKRMRIRAIGKMELLPESTVKAIKEAEEATRDYDAFFLNVAVGYGGRQEIADAVATMLRDKSEKSLPLDRIIEEISVDEIGKYLYAEDLPDPDLIIRTSGEVRLSGFLLWQSAYSEYYFCDAYWPVFRKIDFLRAIRSYQQRERRFGV